MEALAKSGDWKVTVSKSSPLEGNSISASITAKFILVLMLIVCIFVIRGVGIAVAHWKQIYDVFELDGDDVAIIAGYGENLILGGYDDQQFNGKIFVISKTSEKLTEITRVVFDDFLPHRIREAKTDR